VMTKEGVTILTVDTARHRPALMRGSFPSIGALVLISAVARCVRSSERLQKFFRPPRMSLSDHLPKGSLIGPEGRNVRQGIHAVEFDE